MSETFNINSISQVHEALGLDKPKHPLVTVIKAEDIKTNNSFKDVKIVINLYQITLKQGRCGTLRYGRNSYDYQEGTLIFVSPGQVLEYEENDPGDVEPVGWTLVFHPDLIRKSDLAQKIDGYRFFDYESHEALHLSNDEKITIEELVDKIIKEYSQNLDRHTQNLINSNIEMILDYCVRYYDRQFYTRTNLNSDILSKFESLLKSYYDTDLVKELGVPSISHFAGLLNLSPNYLSDMLKKETGKSAKEHITLFIVDKAKNSLLNSSSSVSEIGYDLGFEYPQHFSNLFKSKTGMSPSEYRTLN